MLDQFKMIGNQRQINSPVKKVVFSETLIRVPEDSAEEQPSPRSIHRIQSSRYSDYGRYPDPRQTQKSEQYRQNSQLLRKRSSQRQAKPVSSITKGVAIVLILTAITAIKIINDKWPHVVSSNEVKPVEKIHNVVNTDQCQIGDKLIQIRDLRQRETPYLKIESLMPYDELSICVLVVESDQHSLMDIRMSLLVQNFKNYRAVYLKRPSTNLDETFATDRIETVDSGYTYQTYKKAINKHCKMNDLMLIASSPLVGNALRNINYIHQTFSSWISYNFIDGRYHIFSFYRRIFELIESNDFEGSNKIYFSKEDPGFLALSFLELCNEHKRKIKISAVYKDLSHVGRIHVGMEKCVAPFRKAYQRLKSLNQNYPVNIAQINKNYAKMMEDREDSLEGYKAWPNRGMSLEKALMAMEYQELQYLPKTHSLRRRQRVMADKYFHISKYSHEELPFCITMLSRNNTENQQYKKMLMSILSQQYKNYRIIAIDDHSDDGTLKEIKKYLEERKFPSERVVYVGNLERKFATYNIIHAAYSYCKKDEIQLVVDAGDELIGTQILSIFNAGYHSNENIWLYYGTHVSNHFSYGQSKPYHRTSSVNGKRKVGNYIGPLRSWWVKLIRQIPLEYHQFGNGKWIDLAKDDVLEYSLGELANSDHIKYVPHISYLYKYGDMELSKKRLEHRRDLFLEIISKQALPPAVSLDSAPPKEPIVKIFREQRGQKFIDSLGMDYTEDL